MNLKNFKNLIKYSIATVFVEPYEKEAYYCPVNLLLIAPAECGKTRLLDGILCKKTYETLDLSPKVIKEKIIPKIEQGETSFLIIADLIQLLGHKKITSNTTIHFLNALMEEGVKDNDFYGLEFHLNKKINCGVLAGVTTTKFFENLKEWNAIGFLHRIVPVSYNYSRETIIKIHKEIASGEMFRDINNVDLERKRKIKIKIPQRYADDIQLLVIRIVDRFSNFKIKKRSGTKDKWIYFDIKGFRLHDRLRQIARAICFLDGKGKRKEVNASDIQKLYELEQIINLPNTEKWL